MSLRRFTKVQPSGRLFKYSDEARNGVIRQAVNSSSTWTTSSLISHPAVATVKRQTHGCPDRNPYWQRIRRWRNVAEPDFLTYRWQASLVSPGHGKLLTTACCTDSKHDRQKGQAAPVSHRCTARAHTRSFARDTPQRKRCQDTRSFPCRHRSRH